MCLFTTDYGHRSLYSFIRTNQTDVLDTPDLPSVLDGMRTICGMSSSILGNVSGANGELTSASSTPTPTAVPSNSAVESYLVNLLYVLPIPLGLLVL